jgi:hypothetical protein
MFRFDGAHFTDTFAKHENVHIPQAACLPDYSFQAEIEI